MSFTLLSILLTLVGGGPTRPAPQQQEPAERIFFDSLLVALRNSSTVATLPVARCAGQSREVTQTCESLIAERHAELTHLRDDKLHAEDQLERVVADHPKLAIGWYGLGLARLQLARDTAFARGGALMPVGITYFDGALNAFAEALRRDATLAVAAEALASTPQVHPDKADLQARVAILRQVRGILSPDAALATANLERSNGSIDSAIALEMRALATGKVDSGLASLGLARDLYRIGRDADGRDVLMRGAATPTIASRNAYRTDLLSWVASPKELLEWDNLPTTQRTDWIRAFWEKRDAAEGRKSGARLVEHFTRLEYALDRFAVTVPVTGRQKMHSSLPGMEGEAEARAERLALRYSECWPNVTELIGAARTVGHDTPFDYYRPVQDLVDDRGVIWIRHGAPSRTVQSARGDAVAIWQYDLPDGVMELQFRGTDFQGSAGASTLMPTALSMSPGVRNQVCGIDTSLCSTATSRLSGLEAFSIDVYKPDRCKWLTLHGNEAGLAKMLDKSREPEVSAEGSRISPAAIARARDKGRAQIDLATTTDSYRRDFAKAIHPAVQIYGLDRATGGSPRLVIAFALPGDELAHAKRDSASAQVVYPVNIQVIAYSTRDGARTGIDTLRQFATAAPLTSGQFISGLVEVPVTPGEYGVSVIITQNDGHGAIAHLDKISVVGAHPPLVVSDLVLGRENSGVHWNSGTTNVPLNPLNTYPKGGSAEIYFQLSGLTIGTNYQTRFEFFRADDDPKRGSRLTVSFAQPAQHDRLEVARTLGLQQLDPGKYRIKLTVTGAGAETSATGWLTIVK